MPKPLPSQAMLRSLFDYNPKTGLLTRKTSAGGFAIGTSVGYIDTRGYVKTRINKIEYKVHRIIWTWMTGDDPGLLDVDHKNLNRADNCWDNLRLLNRSENKANNKGYKNSKSGIKGVSWSASKKKWLVSRRFNGKYIHLGLFKSLEEAATVSRAWDAR
jgi:hypothetical protein